VSFGGVTPDELANDAPNADAFIVVRISVSVFQLLGLSVTPSEIEGGLPGHCVVPEFTTTIYESAKKQGGKQRWTEIQEALCKASIQVYPQ
jgi:hypothetical protein